MQNFRSEFNSFGEVCLFFQILFLVTLLPVLFKFLSIPGLAKKFTPGCVKYRKNINLKKTTDKIVKFTDYILNRNFWTYNKNTCLKRSLVLYYYLRKLGIDVHICFGVKYNEELVNMGNGNKLAGHAWLLYNGNFFLEKDVGEAKTYKMTYSFPEGENISNERSCNVDIGSEGTPTPGGRGYRARYWGDSSSPP